MAAFSFYKMVSRPRNSFQKSLSISLQDRQNQGWRNWSSIHNWYKLTRQARASPKKYVSIVFISIGC